MYTLTWGQLYTLPTTIRTCLLQWNSNQNKKHKKLEIRKYERRKRQEPNLTLTQSIKTGIFFSIMRLSQRVSAIKIRAAAFLNVEKADNKLLMQKTQGKVKQQMSKLLLQENQNLLISFDFEAIAVFKWGNNLGLRTCLTTYCKATCALVAITWNQKNANKELTNDGFDKTKLSNLNN